MQKLLLLLLSIITTGAAVYADESLYDYELNPGNFNKVVLVNNINVVYTAHTDSAGYVVFRAPKSMADFVIVSNNKETLKIETLPQQTKIEKLPTVFIYSNYLTEAKNESDSTLTIRSVAPCPKFKATQIGNGRVVVENVVATNVEGFINTGNGTVILNGQCTNAKYKMVGTGLIQADNLVSDYVKCDILGGGAIGCWPRFELKVKGIGSTKIYYKGNPEISKRGGGKLFRLDTYDQEEEYNSREE